MVFPTPLKYVQIDRAVMLDRMHHLPYIIGSEDGCSSR